MQNNLVSRFGTQDPTICAVCRRIAGGLAYMPARAPMAKAIWLCSEPVCIALAPSIYFMRQDMLDFHETEALRAAIDAAGPYLSDEIGVTDLYQLDGKQMDEFLRRLYRAFEDALRQRLLNTAKPS